MSKLLNNYNNLKKQNQDTIYLFKSGIFYVALEDDAKYLAKECNLKLTNLNANTVKCGFPCTSFDKYYLMLQNINKDFKIVENDTVSDVVTYSENKQITEILTKINDIDVNTLSVGEAYSFIEKLKQNVQEINKGVKFI